MAADGSVVIDTKLDTTGAVSGIEKLKSGVGGAAKVMAGIFTGIAVGAVAAVTAAFKFAEAASDLSEAQNVVGETFKTTGADVIAWTKTMAESAGMSETAASKYVGSMGAMLKSSGLGEEAANSMSKELVQLTGDMSSFYNLGHEEMWQKIRSGISGETEPLKQLGINMSVANLEAYALAQGINTSWNEMTQAEQVAMRYGYLMQTTADAQGDFGRTLETSFANQLRVAQMQFKSLGVTIGQEFLPIFLDAFRQINTGIASGNWAQVGEGIASAFTDIMAKFAEMAPQFVQMGTALITALVQGLIASAPVMIDSAVALAEGLLDSFITMIPQLAEMAVKVVTSLIKGLLKMAPKLVDAGAKLITGLLTSIGGPLPELIPLMVTAVVGMAEALIANMPLIVAGALALIQGLVQGIIAALPVLIAAVPGLVAAWVAAIVANIEMIMTAGLAILMALIQGIVDNLPLLISTVVSLIPLVIGALLGALPQLITAGMEIIFALLNGILDALPQIIDAFIEMIPQVVDAIIGALPQLITAGIEIILAIILGIVEELPTLIQKFIDMIPEVLGAIIGAVGQLIAGGWEMVKAVVSGIAEKAGDILQAGADIVTGVWEGIKSMASWLWDKITGFFSGIVDGVKGILGIASPSKVFAAIGENSGMSFSNSLLGSLKTGFDGAMRLLDGETMRMQAKVDLQSANASQASASRSMTYAPSYAFSSPQALDTGAILQRMTFEQQQLSLLGFTG